MFTVYQSNKLTSLLSKVCQIIEKKPLSNIFEKEIFIHDNKILFQYLNIFIANKIGISTNIKLYNPHDFIWQLFKKFLSKKNLKNTFNHSIMTWNIMNILNVEDFSECCYKTKNNMNNFKFSLLMAKMFEEYILYCPHWINSWENKKNISTINIHEKWQMKLWIKIIDQNRKNCQNNDHYSNLFYNFKKLIKEKKIKKKDFPRRCFILSSFSLNPSYIKIFEKISPYINIYFLYITPSKKNRLELSEKNTSKNILIELWGQHEKLYDTYIIQSNKKIISCFKKNNKKNLLNNIKNNFSLNQACENYKIKKKILHVQDDSISINICLNKKNEIEVLYEKLLELFSKNPKIKPNDIVVTCLSIDDYIPYINLIFKDLDQNKQIPFFISKKFSKKTKIILSTFNKLLNLPNSRFKNEEILELLNIPEIAKNFNISEEEINILSCWIEEANIRWGIDKVHKESFLFPKNHQNTWMHGIDKLILSYATNNTKKFWKNIVSCSFVNGSRVNLLEKFINFINILKKWKKKIAKSQNLIYWRSLSKNLISDIFYVSEKIEEPIKIIQKNWTKMIDDGLLSNYSDKISINILKKKFIYTYNKYIKNQKILPGAINFCHPKSICYLPFKVICIIGFDYNSTLNKNNMDEVNLLNQYPLIGNLNIYQKYSYLFLQSISCAEELFYISYVGFSIKDQNKLYPSTLVDQLLNYISLNFYLIGNKNLPFKENKKKIINNLCIKYKKDYSYKKININNFTKKNLQNKSKKINEKIYNKSFFNKIVYAKNTFSKINLIDLINFWKHPIRYFVKKTLQIEFNPKKEQVIPTEPFLVNQLDNFKIRNILLNKIIHNEHIKKLYQYFMLSGKLPYGFFGTLFWKKNILEIESIAKKVIEHRHFTKEKKVNFKIQKYQINGILNEVQSTGLLRWKSNLINHKDRISLWLEHLVYSILGGYGESKIIGNKNQIWSFSPLKPDVASKYFLEYIQGYITGIQKPLLLIKSAACWLDHIYDKKNFCIKDNNNIKITGYKKLIETWMGNNYITGEKEDFYIKIIIKKLDKKNINKICAISKKWLLPLLKNKKIIKNEYL
ncbi:exodeoxyribonuclease V subunit gamma [Buchnera aphidicola]|uniref:RecBCD enzyme subunit RecC n=1 Tax=Buchnera aphidicola (Artemisaphis artemisicola) TaxID=1241836 RepID=A0A4D6XLL9_9GAMM|nr:exodeoxyribonuclease V subunit gamma [Buchnera aphidicola]QCI16114.1 exodeoxyribonuclease V subunit gamma [Buchnera aphidicola (Artemisaphis artemisicola)]